MKNKSMYTGILYIQKLNTRIKSMNTGKDQLETN